MYKMRNCLSLTLKDDGIKIVYNYNKNFGEHFYKMYNDTQFIGIIGCIDRKDYCQISNLLVKEEFRRNGYASYLLNNTINEQKNKGYNIMYVNSSKEAIEFYKKHGFDYTSSMSFIDKYIFKLNKATFYKRLVK